MKISEIMMTDVKTCRIDDTLEQATRVMWESDIGVLPVRDDDGRIVGMVTDRDACMAAFTSGQALRDIDVGRAMAKDVVTCEAEDDVAVVTRKMSANKIRRVPVVDRGGHPVGIVSLGDLARATKRSRDVPAMEVLAMVANVTEPRSEPREANTAAR